MKATASYDIPQMKELAVAATDQAFVRAVNVLSPEMPAHAVKLRFATAMKADPSISHPTLDDEAKGRGITTAQLVDSIIAADGARAAFLLDTEAKRQAAKRAIQAATTTAEVAAAQAAGQDVANNLAPQPAASPAA